MHPPLFRPHPLCQQEVDDLVRCHNEHPVLKFVGKCNTYKHNLDRCFKKEKQERVKENHAKRHPSKETWQKLLEEEQKAKDSS